MVAKVLEGGQISLNLNLVHIKLIKSHKILFSKCSCLRFEIRYANVTDCQTSSDQVVVPAIYNIWFVKIKQILCEYERAVVVDSGGGGRSVGSGGGGDGVGRRRRDDGDDGHCLNTENL
ncbi:Hypothetical predicted protein [Octopus vulgaris]|uniref:Uncharacterized protein n=1 Tax=Octopus vulgaris TaxID=6645 RepID=A0AA36BD73_OCTVU|nr:Hypothetical predicted protein [Octopus vulgaris]